MRRESRPANCSRAAARASSVREWIKISHRFGLGEINPAIEKGAPGELAGGGEARAIFQNGFQNQPRREQAAMTTDFHHVLPREGARGAQHAEQHFVHLLAAADDFPEMNRVGRGGGRGKGRLAGGAETGLGNGQGARPGKADDGQPAFPQRRGNRGNSIVKHKATAWRPMRASWFPAFLSSSYS